MLKLVVGDGLTKKKSKLSIWFILLVK